MAELNPLIERLIKQIGRLPGIGRKTAQRIAFYIVQSDTAKITPLIESIKNVKEQLQLCGQCGNFSDQPLCHICEDPQRDPKLICVVEEAKDITYIEKAGSFKGQYHVLGGTISPLEGKNPEDLSIESLLKRIDKARAVEVVMALNLNAEAEVTATYLAKRLKPLGVKITRLAQGLPMGCQLEYADQFSLSKSLEERHVIE